MTATRRDRDRREKRRWSYAEFARLPSDDGNRYEVIAGELHVTPAPRPLHQRVVGKLYRALDEFVEAHALGVALPGPIDVPFAAGAQADGAVASSAFVRCRAAAIS